MSKRPLEDDQHAATAQDEQPSVPESASNKKARSEHEDGGDKEPTAPASHPTNGGSQGDSAAHSGLATTESAAPASGSSNAPAPTQQQPRPIPAVQQHPQQQQQVRPARRPGDHAFFGTTVPDDVVRVVSEFLFEHCNQPNVEPATQYKHTRETDRFFKDNIQGKVRVTVDQKTGQVVPNGIVKKDRVADLDIYSPRNPFDFRISVNIEAPAQMPTGTPQFERNKDRISYRHNHFKTDLTQVKRMDSQPRPGMYQMQRPMAGAGGANPLDMTHELEIEFVHPEELIREREAWIRSGGQQRERFMDMVGWFVDNIRGLAARGGPAAGGGVGGGNTLAGQMPHQRR
ncbi:mRNA-capping enzyme subunit beta [Actinomortierella ambigua]|nr:mRNA-capping enzyme subunit beta [Actinomortierella ambigua]